MNLSQSTDNIMPVENSLSKLDNKISHLKKELHTLEEMRRKLMQDEHNKMNKELLTNPSKYSRWLYVNPNWESEENDRQMHYMQSKSEFDADSTALNASHNIQCI